MNYDISELARNYTINGEIFCIEEPRISRSSFEGDALVARVRTADKSVEVAIPVLPAVRGYLRFKESIRREAANTPGIFDAVDSQRMQVVNALISSTRLYPPLFEANIGV